VETEFFEDNTNREIVVESILKSFSTRSCI
jgi:hypothetical protein